MPTAQTSERIVDLVSRLEQDGSLQRLVSVGLISPKVFGYYEIFTQYDINKRVRNMPSMEAKYAVSVKLNCDVRTVERALKSMGL